MTITAMRRPTIENDDAKAAPRKPCLGRITQIGSWGRRHCIASSSSGYAPNFML